jgi:hypothetical protein
LRVLYYLGHFFHFGKLFPALKYLELSEKNDVNSPTRDNFPVLEEVVTFSKIKSTLPERVTVRSIPSKINHLLKPEIISVLARSVARNPRIMTKLVSNVLFIVARLRVRFPRRAGH